MIKKPQDWILIQLALYIFSFWIDSWIPGYELLNHDDPSFRWPAVYKEAICELLNISKTTDHWPVTSINTLCRTIKLINANPKYS